MNMQAAQVENTLVEVGRALLDGFNAHDLSRWEAQLADGFTASYPSMREGIDRQVAAGYNQVFLVAFPDLHFEIQRTLTNEESANGERANGEVVVYQWLATGTQTGPLALPSGTIPPTGKRGVIPGVLITTVKQGKIVREETYWNQVELLTQLGLA